MAVLPGLALLGAAAAARELDIAVTGLEALPQKHREVTLLYLEVLSE